MDNSNSILLVLTGGTICSFQDKDGERHTNARDTIIEQNVSGVHFVRKIPFDVLSENMTVNRWNTLVSELINYDFESYKGVIILHGTDTLAYTSSMLSVVFAGAKVPIFLVSSQLPLENKNSNGHDNFKTAVDLILNDVKPNVYVPYKNSDGKMYVHLGSRLKQCQNFSDDFFSEHSDMVDWETDSKIYKKIGKIKSEVLKIDPYVGLDYSKFSVENIKAVVHGTYHSQTVCVDADNDKFSVKYLLNQGITVYLEPCNACVYESTANAVDSGITPVFGMTSEMVYVKALVGSALGYEKESLTEFINKKINYEIYY